MTFDQEPEWHLAPRQSGLGIASFVVAILAGVSAVAIVAIAGLIEISTPGGMDEDSPVAMIVGLAIFAIVGFSMLGIGLGVAGLVQPDRSRIFPILGLTFNVMVILGLAGLVVVGLTVA